MKILINLKRGEGDELYGHLRDEIVKRGHEIIKTNFSADEMSKLIDLAKECQVLVSGVDRWNAEALRLIKDHIKLIVRVGVGCDNIDLIAAGQYGIAVANTAGSNANAVAEGALALMLSLCRRVAASDRDMRKGIWNNSLLTTELIGKQVGIIGYGNIGKKLVSLLSGFTKNIAAYDPYISKPVGGQEYVRFASLDELASESDFISVHIPGIPENENMFNKDFFMKMKKNAYFINTSRGSVTDESALVDALNRREIAGAALDVYREEPLAQNSPLLKMENVVLLPHMLSASRESAFATMDMVIQNIEDYFSDKGCSRIVNKVKLK